jgi:hypothetical protein
MSATAPTTSRSPAECAAALDATAAQIDLMSMDERIELLRAMMSGPASELGAGDRWCNMEGVMAFFRDRDMGAPGTWISVVNASVIEGIERGMAICLHRSDDDFDNAGAAQWADYLTRLHRNELTTERAHDTAWSEAKDVGTDFGVAVAARHGLEPTEVERRFLRFAKFYTWVLRNRTAMDMVVLYGGLLDPRLAGLRLVNWFVDVTEAEPARKGCEMAYEISCIEPTPEAGNTLELALARLPSLAEELETSAA